MNKLTCFKCNDGYTPLYCLNCASALLSSSKGERSEAAQPVCSSRGLGVSASERQPDAVSVAVGREKAGSAGAGNLWETFAAHVRTIVGVEPVEGEEYAEAMYGWYLRGANDALDGTLKSQPTLPGATGSEALTPNAPGELPGANNK